MARVDEGGLMRNTIEVYRGKGKRGNGYKRNIKMRVVY